MNIEWFKEFIKNPILSTNDLIEMYNNSDYLYLKINKDKGYDNIYKTVFCTETPSTLYGAIIKYSNHKLSKECYQCFVISYLFLIYLTNSMEMNENEFKNYTNTLVDRFKISKNSKLGRAVEKYINGNDIDEIEREDKRRLEQKKLKAEKDKARLKAEQEAAAAAAKLQAEKDAAAEKKRADDEAARVKAELKKRLEEAAAAKKRLEEEAAAAKKRLEEEDAAVQKKLEEEAAVKKRLEEEAAVKKRLEETAKKRLKEIRDRAVATETLNRITNDRISENDNIIEDNKNRIKDEQKRLNLKTPENFNIILSEEETKILKKIKMEEAQKRIDNKKENKSLVDYNTTSSELEDKNNDIIVNNNDEINL
jgi:hypothetical protein